MTNWLGSRLYAPGGKILPIEFTPFKNQYLLALPGPLLGCLGTTRIPPIWYVLNPTNKVCGFVTTISGDTEIQLNLFKEKSALARLTFVFVHKVAVGYRFEVEFQIPKSTNDPEPLPERSQKPSWEIDPASVTSTAETIKRLLFQFAAFIVFTFGAGTVR